MFAEFDPQAAVADMSYDSKWSVFNNNPENEIFKHVTIVR